MNALVHLCVCYLHVDQCVVDSLFFHQFIVSTQLHNFSVLEAGDDISVSDSRETVGHNDGGATLSGLDTKMYSSFKCMLPSVCGFWVPDDIEVCMLV